MKEVEVAADESADESVDESVDMEDVNGETHEESDDNWEELMGMFKKQSFIKKHEYKNRGSAIKLKGDWHTLDEGVTNGNAIPLIEHLLWFASSEAREPKYKKGIDAVMKICEKLAGRVHSGEWRETTSEAQKRDWGMVIKPFTMDDYAGKIEDLSIIFKYYSLAYQLYQPMFEREKRMQMILRKVRKNYNSYLTKIPLIEAQLIKSENFNKEADVEMKNLSGELRDLEVEYKNLSDKYHQMNATLERKNVRRAERKKKKQFEFEKKKKVEEIENKKKEEEKKEAVGDPSLLLF